MLLGRESEELSERSGSVDLSVVSEKNKGEGNMMMMMAEIVFLGLVWLFFGLIWLYFELVEP